MTDVRIPTPDELEAMTVTQYKVLENRLRRAAARQGLQLVKSRSRDPRAVDYGGYMIVDAYRNFVVAGELGSPSAMGLNEVAEYLWGDDEGDQ